MIHLNSFHISVLIKNKDWGSSFISIKTLKQWKVILDIQVEAQECSASERKPAYSNK